MIVPESVTSTELAEASVTTVKIADANVTKAKLSAEVQASLDKADVAEGNAKAYADELNGAMDERVGAIEDLMGEGEGTVTEQISTAKGEAIAAAAADAEAKANAAEAAAKAYADEEIDKVEKVVNENAAAIQAINDSLAEGGEVANAIAAAKKAGDDADAKAQTAQDEVDALELRVDALENADTFVEITTDEVNALFA